MMKTGILVVMGVALWGVAGCSAPAIDADGDLGEISQALEPTPVAWWKFDACAGDSFVPNAQGSWGAANLLNGAECKGGGAFNTAGHFDGIDDVAFIPYDERLDFTTGMSVSAWVKPDEVMAPQTIVGKWYGPDSYLLSLSDGEYHFSIVTGNGTRTSISAPASAGVYSQVVGTFGGHHLKLFINGSQVAISPTGTYLQSSTRPVTIGNHPSWNPFRGRIDEVKLFNVAISQFSMAPTHCFALGCNPPSNCCEP